MGQAVRESKTIKNLDVYLNTLLFNLPSRFNLSVSQNHRHIITLSYYMPMVETHRLGGVPANKLIKDNFSYSFSVTSTVHYARH